MRHALTIDLEDYYMSPPEIGPEDWARFPDRLGHSVPLLLDWLAEREQEATFFALGAVAANEPRLIRRIADAGHEVVIHGWDHSSVEALGPGRFGIALDDALDAVQSATGRSVEGFRAAARFGATTRS